MADVDSLTKAVGEMAVSSKTGGIHVLVLSVPNSFFSFLSIFLFSFFLFTGLTYDPRMCGHQDPQSDHPECPERIVGIYEELEKAGLVKRCERIAARDVTFDEVATVHDRKYCQLVWDMQKMSLSELM